jgi:hypothetical protein
VRVRRFTSVVASLMALAGLAVAASSRQAQKQPENQSHYIDAFDLGLTHDMLSQIHGVLKHNYHDPSFHGLDIDARYQTYSARLDNAKNLLDGYRIIAAYLSGLDDPHTLFIPPANNNRVTYGYRAQMIGDRCFVTDVRPDTDAAQKLHAGDQLLSLDGYVVNANDLRQLEYYLDVLAPKKNHEPNLTRPSGQGAHGGRGIESAKGSAICVLDRRNRKDGNGDRATPSEISHD